MTSAAALPAPAHSAGELAPDWEYLTRHGLDQVTSELRFPPGAEWHCQQRCVHPDCDRVAARWPWLCPRCDKAWRAAGREAGNIADWCTTFPVAPARRTYGTDKPCLVGCVRPAEALGLCRSCAAIRSDLGLSVADYLASRPRPRQGFGNCAARSCTRMAAVKQTRLCAPHQQQWVRAGRPDRQA